MLVSVAVFVDNTSEILRTNQEKPASAGFVFVSGAGE
jgi:hypothetical protein